MRYPDIGASVYVKLCLCAPLRTLFITINEQELCARDVSDYFIKYCLWEMTKEYRSVPYDAENADVVTYWLQCVYCNVLDHNILKTLCRVYVC